MLSLQTQLGRQVQRKHRKHRKSQVLGRSFWVGGQLEGSAEDVSISLRYVGGRWRT